MGRDNETETGKGCFFRDEWFTQLRLVPPEHAQDVQDVLQCLQEYGVHGREPDMTGMSWLTKLLFFSMKDGLDTDRAGERRN